MAKREMDPCVAKVRFSPALLTVQLFEGDKSRGTMYIARKNMSTVLPTEKQVRRLFKEGYLLDVDEVTIEVDSEK